MILKAVCIQTHHTEALVSFYTKIFGHEPYVDQKVDFRFTNEQLTIFKLREDEPNTKNIALIYEVDDVDGEYRRLDALNLCDRGEPTDKSWGVRSFLISDPDGNTVSFTKNIL